MSIYATWAEITMRLRPWEDRDVELTFQAVPGHIGHPKYYDDDYFGTFLPPPVEDEDALRAMVIIDDRWSEKDGQRYVCPLLTLSGTEWATMPLASLWPRLEQRIAELEDYES